MDPRNVRTVDDALRVLAEHPATHHKVGIFDIDGVLRGKFMSRAKLESALRKGFGFCDVVVGWDSNDQLYDNVQVTGWHTGYPDAHVRLIPESCRTLPEEGDGLFFLGELSGAHEAVCPRGTLRRVLDRAASMGFAAKAGLEFEFFVFDETPKSVRAKGYRDLEPITPGNFGYSVLRAATRHSLYEALLGTCEAMDLGIEGLHTETGPGVLEAALTVDEALAAADKAAMFKTWCKIVAQRREMMATFMARWSTDYPGQSGHTHLSLVDAQSGEPVFHDSDDAHGMSRTMRQFVAGCRAYMPEMLALVASTVNSYTRLVPGFWAPTQATWGVENRTCALRVVGGSPSATRVEYRVAAADANPYLAVAAALASGLAGIEQDVDPGEPITGNAYELPPDPPHELPRTLMQASERLAASAVARDWLGDVFVDHFAASRAWEEREFRKHVTDWELQRYFEII
jgi:glutamine synthetase